MPLRTKSPASSGKRWAARNTASPSPVTTCTVVTGDLAERGAPEMWLGGSDCGGAEVEAYAPLTGSVRRGGRGYGQETAALTSSATLFSTTALHFCSANSTGHRSPSSRLAASWKPRVEYR